MSQKTAVSRHFLVIEDQTLMRQFVVLELKKRYAGCRITEAASLEEIQKIDSANLAHVDLAIVDLELADGCTLEWVIAYAERPGGNRVLLVSSVEEPYVFYHALRAGIVGFVHKLDGFESLLLGVATTLEGSMYYSPNVLTLKRDIEKDPSYILKILSETEQKILRLLGEGHTNEEIAQLEGYKISTVLDHRNHIMQKLSIKTSDDLVRCAFRTGFAHL